MTSSPDRPIDAVDTAAFEQSRLRLLGLAYRLLGSRADAEDAVQDTFLKWQGAQRSAIQNPTAWLTTACTRHCLDLMRNAHRSRVHYVGPWLPEPVLIDSGTVQEGVAELASSLSSAFLLMLERLTPKERAAYLLHDIFDAGYPDIAQTLGMNEPACRQLVARARTHVEGAKVRHITPPRRQAQLLSAFEWAVREGDTDALARVLSDDVRLASDGGGKRPAVRRILMGSDQVCRFVARGLHVWWGDVVLERALLNGKLGLINRDAAGQVVSATSFSHDRDHNLDGIFIMRNPDKLALVDTHAWPVC